MPLKLRSITGKIPYDVELQIRDLVESHNRLEQRLEAMHTQKLTASAPPAVASTNGRLSSQQEP